MKKEKTTCNCQAEIRKSIVSGYNEDDYKNISVHIDLNNVCYLSDKKIPERTGQRLTISYERKLRNGRWKYESRKSFAGHKYCPWCGRKYQAPVTPQQ